MIDITLLPKIVELVGVTGTTDAVDAARTDMTFTGVELAPLVGLEGVTVGAVQQLCTSIPVAQGFPLRGCLLVCDGYLCVSVGDSRVIEPAGRQWALIAADPSRYQWAGLSPQVIYTIGRP